MIKGDLCNNPERPVSASATKTFMLNQRSEKPRPFYRYTNEVAHRPQVYPLDLGTNSSAEQAESKFTEKRLPSPDPSVHSEVGVIDTWEQRAHLLSTIGDTVNAKIFQALKVRSLASRLS